MRNALCLALLVVATGCEGELNQAYCAEHRDDPDCLAAGYVRLDAPAPECASDMDCVGDPDGTQCDTQRKTCVECVYNRVPDVCAASMEHCGPDQVCHGCVTDGDCNQSGVCLPNEQCAAASAVLYVSPNGSGTSCANTAPCKLADAVTQLSAARHIIKVTTGNYTDPPIAIASPFGVQIIATGVVWVPTGGGDAITASGANLEVLGLTIDGAIGDGVRCTAGSLTLRDVTIKGSGAWGVETTACDTDLQRNRISSNPSGAISVTDGKHEIRNNILDKNGNSNLDGGNVHVATASGRFMFNTLVESLSRSGNRVGGIGCSEASPGSFVVAQNIVADWGSANNSVVGCTRRGNYIVSSVSTVQFGPNYHLTANSPKTNGSTLGVLDDEDIVLDLDCQDGGEHIDDIDREARPFQFCDRGADEYVP